VAIIFKLALVSSLVGISLFAQSSIVPIPKQIIYDKEKAQLGKKLFFETQLSKDGSVSCATCHTLPGNGANKTQYSFGIEGTYTNVNAPTVLNSVFNFSYFYNGRVKNLKEQVVASITKKDGLGSTMDSVVAKLKGSSYAQEFFTVYENGVTKENIVDALVEFEKALITPNSRFDKFLRGDVDAINAKEKRGYKKFVESGCVYCHNGRNVGGNEYQKMGVFEPYESIKTISSRYDVTKRERDKNVYKVPSLRNVALTAPYLHDGSIKTLKEVISVMYEYQLGVKPNKKDVSDIEAFLKTLTGEMPSIVKGDK